MNSININVQASLGARDLDRNQALLSRSLNRLSSGSKLSNPGDDPAGLATAASLAGANQRLSAAATNVQNGISYAQTADGFLSTMAETVARMGQLSSMANDPTKNASDVANYQAEFTSLQDQLRATIGGTAAQIGGPAGVSTPIGTFDGHDLFGSSTAGGQTISVGADPGQDMTIPDTDLRQGSMLALIQQDSSGNYTLSLGSPALNAAITGGTQSIAAERATLGAAESRLGMIGSTLTVQQQNVSSAISSIQDVDVATESTQLAKYNILVQSSTAMLAQANLSPQSVLKLLGNGA